MKLLSAFLDIIFPPRCLVCGRPGPEPMCSECIASVEYSDGVPLYEGAMKEAITRFKFERKRALLNPLSWILITAYNGDGVDLITAVPLFSSRLKERGFNQSELLAERLADHLGVPSDFTLIERVRDTRPQFDLKRHERLSNVSGAFRFSGNDVRGKKILIVDDIMTTGATLSECSKALKEAGAAIVIPLVLSKTPQG